MAGPFSGYTTMRIADVEDQQNKHAWEYEETILAASEGKSIIIPEGVSSIGVTLFPDGTAKVQATTDLVANVKDGSAVFVDWDFGEVTETTQDSCVPVSAIRQVSILGGSRISVRAQ